MTISNFRAAHIETTDGARIAYRVRAGRDPWVLIHGLGCDASMWEGVVASLPRDRGVVLVEIRGHGGSTLGWRVPSVDLWAEDVLAVIRAESLERPAVGGLSMGGYTALALAAAAPGAARGYAFVSTSAAPDDDIGRGRRAAGLTLLRERGWRAFLEGLAPALLAPGRADNDRNAAHLATMFARAAETGLSSALWALANRPDRRALLRWIDAPVAVIAGDADQLIPPDRAREIASALRRATVHVLPGVGHMSAMEDPERVTAALEGVGSP